MQLFLKVIKQTFAKAILIKFESLKKKWHEVPYLIFKASLDRPLSDYNYVKIGKRIKKKHLDTKEAKNSKHDAENETWLALHCLKAVLSKETKDCFSHFKAHARIICHLK